MLSFLACYANLHKALRFISLCRFRSLPPRHVPFSAVVYTPSRHPSQCPPILVLAVLCHVLELVFLGFISHSPPVCLHHSFWSSVYPTNGQLLPILENETNTPKKLTKTKTTKKNKQGTCVFRFNIFSVLFFCTCSVTPLHLDLDLGNNNNNNTKSLLYGVQSSESPG